MALTKMAALIGHLPVSGLEKIGRGFGHLAYWLDIRHRRIVSQNIAFIYPGWNSRQRRRLAKQVFQHFGIIVLEILQAPFLSRQKLIECISIEGQDILRNALNHPRGCLLFSAHLGNWEIGLLGLSAKLNHPVMTVAKPIKWKLAHNWLTSLRSRFGNKVFFKEGAMPWMIQALREGQTLAVLIDQGVRRKESVEVTFLGRKTLATPAVTLLALRCRMPVVPLFCVRDSHSATDGLPTHGRLAARHSSYHPVAHEYAGRCHKGRSGTMVLVPQTLETDLSRTVSRISGAAKAETQKKGIG